METLPFTSIPVKNDLTGAALSALSTHETHAQQRGHGLWGDPSVPKRGWTLDETFDFCDTAGDSLETCEMCLSAEIRYGHMVSHPNYPVRLIVGCVCAGNLTGDAARAAYQEKGLRSLARRRATWSSKTWERPRPNVYLLKSRGLRTVVEVDPRAGAGWFVYVYRPSNKSERLFSTKFFPTVAEAQVAAFDVLERARKAGY